MPLFEIDYKNRFMETIKANDIHEAEQKAKELYPNVYSSIQVWPLSDCSSEAK